MECFICCRFFLLNEIVDYVDLCVDVWVGIVEDEVVLIIVEEIENFLFRVDDIVDFI